MVVKYDNVTVKLIGEDGNAFAIIGNVSRAIQREAGSEAAAAFRKEATDCDSYDALLAHVQNTVHVS